MNYKIFKELVKRVIAQVANVTNYWMRFKIAKFKKNNLCHEKISSYINGSPCSDSFFCANKTQTEGERKTPYPKRNAGHDERDAGSIGRFEPGG